MSPESAARLLRDELNRPSWAVAIWPWHGDGKTKLIVKVDPSYRPMLGRVPSSFHGYRVTVEDKEDGVAHVGAA